MKDERCIHSRLCKVAITNSVYERVIYNIIYTVIYISDFHTNELLLLVVFNFYFGTTKSLLSHYHCANFWLKLRGAPWTCRPVNSWCAPTATAHPSTMENLAPGA